MLGQAVPQREKQMEEPISNKNECNGAWDFQRRFQVKPNYGSAPNFRMRVPLPYCKLRHWLFCFDGGIQGADIALYIVIMCISLQHLLHYLPDHRLLRVISENKSARSESA